MEKVGLEAFKQLCKQTWEQRKKVDQLSKVANEEGRKLEELKAKLLAHMEHYEIEKEHVPGFGLLYVQNRFSVKVPQGDEKLKFFNYLKDNGIFETLATVHSNTLNSWYKEKLEAALAQGEIEVKIPGISEAKMAKTLGFKGE